MTINPFSLDGKVAIVTGSGRGLGKGVAIGMGAAGARVVTCSRTLAEAEATAQEIQGAGGEALALTVDITQKASCEALVAQTLEHHGRLDVLVCNAAANLQGPALEIDEETWNTTLAVELSGYFFCAQAAAPAMIEQGGGSIVMIGANSSMVGYAGLVTVAAAKGGVDQLVRNLAVEWGQHGIRINSINPGYTEHLPPAGDVAPGDSGDVDEDVRRLTPLPRRGRIEEFAHPAVFLASDAASFITGQNLAVDGGYAIK